MSRASLRPADAVVGKTATSNPFFTAAICQLTSIDDLQANGAQILSLLEQLEEDPPDLVCFPENALFFRIRPGSVPPRLTLEHPVIRQIAEWSARYKSAVHLGSVPLLVKERLFSSSVLITPEGQITSDYSKIHLFDVNVEGHQPVRESDVFSHGQVPYVFTLKGWKFGSSICYDLRFAELYLRYARAEVDAILTPSAFLVPTGRAHWDVLTRARAIESQAYLLAAAQGGVHKSADGTTRSTYGHSVAIDPWGEVLAMSPEAFTDGQRILRVTLTRDRINQVRRQIPVGQHRRLDVGSAPFAKGEL